MGLLYFLVTQVVDTFFYRMDIFCGNNVHPTLVVLRDASGRIGRVFIFS